MIADIRFKHFDKWWAKVAKPKMDKYIKAYLRNNPDYTEEDAEDYSDSGCVHRLIHEGDAADVLWDTCQEVFNMGYDDEDWKMDMSQSLFCELDDIIELAYEAGAKATSK